MWEAIVLNAIIHDDARPDAGEWDAEAVVEALRAMRDDPELVDELSHAAPARVIETFLHAYEAHLRHLRPR